MQNLCMFNLDYDNTSCHHSLMLSHKTLFYERANKSSSCLILAVAANKPSGMALE